MWQLFYVAAPVAVIQSRQLFKITKNVQLLRSEFVTQSFISLVSDDYRAFHLHVTPRNETLILFITDWDARALKSRKTLF